MVHASLFSGIGGFELPAEWMGWTNLFHCEIDPFPRKVIQYYWPNSISYEDIRNTDFTIHRSAVDILTGGFPCQPYSMAGKRLGKEDERHLWPEMCRAIREIKPTWVVGENVRGIVSWNEGLVFQEVQADLEAQGYEVQSFILPAASVGAPHIRQRVFFIAHSASNRRLRQRKKIKEETKQKRLFKTRQLARRPQRSCISQSITYTNSLPRISRYSKKTHSHRIRTAKECKSIRNCVWCRTETTRRARLFTHSTSLRTRKLSYTSQEARTSNSSQLFRCICRVPFKSILEPDTHVSRRQKQHYPQISTRSRFACRPYNANRKTSLSTYTISFRRWYKSDWKRKSKLINKIGGGDHWRDFPTQPPVCSRNDGIPPQMDRYTIPEITLRRKSIEAYGNGVVPQLVLQIFKTIEKFNKLINE